MRRVLKGKKGYDHCQDRDETGLTLLGAALGYHAPLDIIELIITVDPNQLTAVDTFGANALHLACLNGAPSTSVACILKKCGELASSRDKDNRVPLHHATECICRDEIEFAEGLKVIEVLCRFDPNMIHAQDRSENSPLDLVHIVRNKDDLSELESKRLVKLCWFLRKISFRVHKHKKKKWELSQSKPWREGDIVVEDIFSRPAARKLVLTDSTVSMSASSIDPARASSNLERIDSETNTSEGNGGK